MEIISNSYLSTYMKMRHQASAPKIVSVDFAKDLKKYSIDTPEFKKNFDYDKNTITAKSECVVTLNQDDYDDKFFIEAKDYFFIPGVISIRLANDETLKTFTLPFNYQVKLRMTGDVERDGKEITIRYVPGDVIVEQNYYQKDNNVAVVIKLLEGRTKYLNKPELLVLALNEHISNLDLVAFELIVQNMFRDASDPMKPARLTDYTNFEIYGQKKLPFITSWVNALSFENPKKAIRSGLLTGQDADDDPITKIVNEKFGGGGEES